MVFFTPIQVPEKNMCCRIKETCDDLSYLENKPATAR
jgi:hypothetical protein